ncbi:helix-turn-helix domain-containing protein [Elizabethkingia ursingii]
MEEVKQISLQELSNNFKDLHLQEGYIYIPEFRISPDLTEPYRSGYYCIGYITEGEMIMQSNLIRQSLKAPAIIFADPASVKSWEIPQDSYQAKSILISENFLQEKIIESNILSVFSGLSGNGTFIAPLTKKTSDQIKAMFKIIDAYTPPTATFHKEIIHGIVYSMLNIIGSLYDHTDQHSASSTNKLNLRFRKAVSQHAIKERDLGFYADLLHIHPKYLSKVIRAETGRTASEWIQQQVILEAKILLQKANLSIKDVSELLHFPEQSTFGKYFKKYAGKSPNEYRDSLHQHN